MFERTVLPGGPRVISARLPGTRSLAVAVYVPVGSRHESGDDAGLAHFMEHVTFRGTASWPTSRAVSEAVEGVGGTANAATDRESTVYWVRLPVREAELAFSILGDLVVRPRLEADDVRREREIIVEEIRSYRDDPSQHVFGLWDGACFGDGPMGREIAGLESTVLALTEERVRAFHLQAYRPERMVVAVAGDLPHDRALELARGAFGVGVGSLPVAAPAPAALPLRRTVTEARATSQTNLCIGVPALRRDHPDQWALELLTTILGEGGSSRLFLSVREEAGLAYDVHAFTTDYADCGTLQVFAGVDPADAGKATSAILAELARLRDEPIPAAELGKARRYLLGRLELRLEESRAMASWLGGQEALHDRVLGLDDVIAALEAVTTDDVSALAQRLFRDEVLCMAAIGPRGTLRGATSALRLP